jgi:hypothetical protein
MLKIWLEGSGLTVRAPVKEPQLVIHFIQLRQVTCGTGHFHSSSVQETENQHLKSS